MEFNKELGKELDLDIKMGEGGMAIVSISHEGKLGHVKLEAGISAVLLVDKITDMIPGEMDDMVIDKWVESLLSKKSK